MPRRSQQQTGSGRHQQPTVLVWAVILSVLALLSVAVLSRPAPVIAGPAASKPAPVQQDERLTPHAVEVPGVVPTPDNRLTGTVVGPRDQPIAGASVALGRRWAEGYWLLDQEAMAERSWFARATTDSRGRFGFDVPEAVPFDLVVQAPDLAGRTLPRCAGGRDYLVRLDAGSTISGRVLVSRSEGAVPFEPLLGAKVSLHTATLADVRRSVTDSEGRYLFEAVRAGIVQLDVQAEGARLPAPVRRTIPSEARIEQTLRLLAEPVPDVSHEAASNRPQPPARKTRLVTGRVIGAEGAPIPQAYVALIAGADSRRGIQTAIWHATVSDADGRFRVEAVTGLEQALFVRAEGSGRRTYVLPRVVPGDEPLALPDVALLPSSRLIGVVRAKDGSPLPTAVVRIEGANEDRYAWAMEAGPAGDPYVSTTLLETDGEGRFVCAELAAGRYLVRASPDGALDLVVTRQVELAEGEIKRLELEIDFGLTVAGVVVNAAGLAQPGATVELLDVAAGRSDPQEPGRSMVTAPDGAFLFRGLAAGRYRVSVTPSPAEPPVTVDVDAGTVGHSVVVPELQRR